MLEAKADFSLTRPLKGGKQGAKMDINWKASSKEEVRTINAIARRAVKHAVRLGIEYSLMDADMDLTATHLNGYPLRLEELLAADDFNFEHDVFGIRRHINRETGKLENCFLPRFARPARPAPQGAP